MTGERLGVGHDPSRAAAYVEGWIAAMEVRLGSSLHSVSTMEQKGLSQES